MWSAREAERAMTELMLEVQDGDITIWLPGSSYAVTYYTPKDVLSSSPSASGATTIRA